MPLSPGDPAPWFTAATPSNPQFVFDTVAGRYVLLVFLPVEPNMRGVALRGIAKRQAQLREAGIAVFAVVRDAQTWEGARDLPGLQWFNDLSGRLSRGYRALDADGTERPQISKIALPRSMGA